MSSTRTVTVIAYQLHLMFRFSGRLGPNMGKPEVSQPCRLDEAIEAMGQAIKHDRCTRAAIVTGDRGEVFALVRNPNTNQWDVAPRELEAESDATTALRTSILTQTSMDLTLDNTFGDAVLSLGRHIHIRGVKKVADFLEMAADIIRGSGES
jgi:hypothetical protein